MVWQLDVGDDNFDDGEDDDDDDVHGDNHGDDDEDVDEDNGDDVDDLEVAGEERVVGGVTTIAAASSVAPKPHNQKQIPFLGGLILNFFIYVRFQLSSLTFRNRLFV